MGPGRERENVRRNGREMRRKAHPGLQLGVGNGSKAAVAELLLAAANADANGRKRKERGKMGYDGGMSTQHGHSTRNRERSAQHQQKYGMM